MVSEILKVDHVSFSYQDLPVLKDICFKFYPGRFYGILGPNGSGKSTLLDILLGFKTPDKGNVYLFKNDIKKIKKSQIGKKISYVPQSFTFNFPFSVDEIVTMGRYPYIKKFSLPTQRDLEIVEQIQREIDIFKFKHRLITELSGGERQRVMIARALAQDTPIFLLDEPTSNLDIKHSLRILESFKKRVINNNRTVICVFHNINEALFFCDELIFLKDGKIIIGGPTAEVISKDILEQIFEVEVLLRFEEKLNCYQVIFTNRRYKYEKKK